MENEIWKDIIIEKNGVVYNFTGKYQVSNMGRVRSLNYRGNTKEIRVLKSLKNKYGYLYIGLIYNTKKEKFYIHRLVATMFIKNEDSSKTEVNHISEDKLDCRVNNLEWVTPKQNANHGTRNRRIIETKLNGKRSKKIICLETSKVYPSLNEAKRKLGVEVGSISACCRGKQNTAGGYHWKYYTDYLLEINEKNEQLISA